MGSYLSIVNDTQDTWQCQVGTDMAALEIFAIITSVVTAIVGAIATAGAAAPIFASAVANGVVSILGLSTETALAVTEAAASIAGTAGFAKTAVGVLASVVAFSGKHFENLGYTTIPPGQKHQYGKYTLSLWQQGHCVRHRSFPDQNMTYIVDELYMRPIFSGATDNSNIDHSITFWYNKFGPENAMTFQVSPPDGKASWGDVNALLVMNAPTTTAPTLPSASGSGTIAPTPMTSGGTNAPTTASSGGTIAPTPLSSSATSAPTSPVASGGTISPTPLGSSATSAPTSSMASGGTIAPTPLSSSATSAPTSSSSASATSAPTLSTSSSATSAPTSSSSSTATSTPTSSSSSSATSAPTTSPGSTSATSTPTSSSNGGGTSTPTSSSTAGGTSAPVFSRKRK